MCFLQKHEIRLSFPTPRENSSPFSKVTNAPHARLKKLVSKSQLSSNQLCCRDKFKFRLQKDLINKEQHQVTISGKNKQIKFCTCPKRFPIRFLVFEKIKGKNYKYTTYTQTVILTSTQARNMTNIISVRKDKWWR